MYPAGYCRYMPPTCPHCIRGKRYSATHDRLIDCDQCNGTGVEGEPRYMLAIALISIAIVYGLLLWKIIHG